MVNGIGVLGWGVGGIEAEAAMLGQPIFMILPEVIGLKLSGKLKEGITTTDLVLSITEKLRSVGVVGKIVELFGDGIKSLSVTDRATISNMSLSLDVLIHIGQLMKEQLNILKCQIDQMN